MYSVGLTNEELLSEIVTLPAEERRKVERYIEQLHIKNTSPAITVPLEKEEAFGMWRDRDDMKDSSAWVRKIRGGA